MMAGNPSWWSIMMNGMHPHEISVSSSNSHHHQFVYPSLVSDDHNTTSDSSHHQPPPHDQDFPARSWGQLLLGGGEGGGGERYSTGSQVYHHEEQKKFENWELDQVFNLNNSPISLTTPNTNRADHVKQEAPQSYATHVQDHEFIHANRGATSNLWSVNHHQQLMPLSSPNSCITTTSLSCNNILSNFTGGKAEVVEGKRNRQQYQDNECDSGNGGVSNKKARVQQNSSSQPVMKVRKEKLMDRITALHQIVSPFGKTDTASVLSEAIAYIRFLQGQIQALSSPYMRNGTESTGHHHQHSESQLGIEGEIEGLRSRGLCLVPISNCTQHVGNDNINGAAADYWASSALGGATTGF